MLRRRRGGHTPHTISAEGLSCLECRCITCMTLQLAARRLFGDVATRLQVPLTRQPIIRYRQPPASLVRHGWLLLAAQSLARGYLIADSM